MANWLMMAANWLTEAVAAVDWDMVKAACTVRTAGIGEEAVKVAANQEVEPSVSWLIAVAHWDMTARVAVDRSIMGVAVG